MLLPLLQHLQLRSQSEDSILGSILSLLGALPAKPTPHARHLDCVSDDSEVLCRRTDQPQTIFDISSRAALRLQKGGGRCRVRFVIGLVIVGRRDGDKVVSAGELREKVAD